VYESTHKVLHTIRSSSSSSTHSSSNGGILHDTSKKIRELLNEGYPRGRKEVTSLLTKEFPPVEQQAWFEERGVVFRVERDGSMVVDMNDAATTTANDVDDNDAAGSSKICDAILSEDVAKLVETSTKITSISKTDDNDYGDTTNAGFQLTIQGRDEVEHCNCLILATGNSHLGHQLATSLHHTIQNPVRSSFAFLLDSTNPLFSDLLEEAGVHHRRQRKQQQQQQQQHFLLPHVRLSYKVKIKGRKRPRVHKSEGPARLELLHNNNNINDEDDDDDDDAATMILAGKAASSLSSLAAYDLHNEKCTGSLFVHFCAEHLGGKVEMIEKDLWRIRQEKPREVVGDKCPFVHRFVDYDEYDWETESFKVIETECIPAELWASMTESCGAPPNSIWGKMSPKKVRHLAELVVGCPFEFKGRVASTASGGDPFINAGGILLNEMDMSTMKSKVVENLFCCGQVLDGDASASGFSFMRDFAMGKVAGENAALLALQSIKGGDE